ncbi:MAG: hypothetical protein WA197_15185 [Candidatus Acidiferrales bacterium]
MNQEVSSSQPQTAQGSARVRKSRSGATNWTAIGLFAAMMAIALTRALPGSAQNAIWYPIGATIVLLICYATGRSVVAHVEDKRADGECLVFARKTNPIWLYLGAGAIGFAVIATAMSVANRRLFASSDLQIGLSMFGYLLGTLAAFFGSIQLRVTHQKMEYWSLERGYQALDRDDIDVARYRVGLSADAPYMRLEIFPRSPKNKPIYVPVMLLQKTELEHVYDWLGTKLAGRPV